MPGERLNIFSAAARNSAAFSPYFALGCTSTVDPHEKDSKSGVGFKSTTVCMPRYAATH